VVVTKAHAASIAASVSRFIVAKLAWPVAGSNAGELWVLTYSSARVSSANTYARRLVDPTSNTTTTAFAIAAAAAVAVAVVFCFLKRNNSLVPTNSFAG
jgi:hypothetical protein